MMLRNAPGARDLVLHAFTGRAASALSRLLGFRAGRHSPGFRFALRGVLFLAVGLLALMGLSVTAKAQTITSAGASPTSFSGAGQTITFSVTFNTGGYLSHPLIFHTPRMFE